MTESVLQVEEKLKYLVQTGSTSVFLVIQDRKDDVGLAIHPSVCYSVNFSVQDL